MANVKGLPSAADIILATDALASEFKAVWQSVGRGDPNEPSTTWARKAMASRDKIAGDGTTGNPGVSNVDIRRQMIDSLQRRVSYHRWDMAFKDCTDVFNLFDNWIQTGLPDGFSFQSGTQRALDLWLLRLNANGPLVPATPTFTPSLTATTGGAMGAVTSGNAPRAKFTYRSTSDWLESLPSVASAQVAIASPNSAYTVTPAGNSLVTGYMNAYRQLYGAAVGDPYYYDGRIAVVSGQPHPTYTFVQNDQQLHLDWSPPSYLSCAMTPEAAFLFADAYGTLPATAGAQGGLLNFSTQAMMSPSNVALNPAYITALTSVLGFQGYNNPLTNGILAQWAAGTKTYGTIQSANNIANGLQGYIGAANGLRAHVVSALDVNASITALAYNYYDSAHGATLQTNGTLSGGPYTLVKDIDSTVDLGIPAGRVEVAITSVTVSGAATGTFVIESNPVRTL